MLKRTLSQVFNQGCFMIVLVSRLAGPG